MKNAGTKTRLLVGGNDTARQAEHHGNSLSIGFHSSTDQHRPFMDVPAALQPGRIGELAEQLRREHKPRDLEQELLVREVARHAAALEIIELGEGGLLRESARGFAKFLNDNTAADDPLLAAAVTAEPLERVTRYRRAHEKAMAQAMNALRDLCQEHDRQAQLKTVPADLFATDEACRRHLFARFSDPDWCCPKCRSAIGHWLSQRQAWECAGCHKQFGLRFGTVMASSNLPLTTWFAAIRYQVADGKIRAVDLARLLRLGRPATAQLLIRRFQEALKTEDPPARLAGLTRYPLWPN